MATTRKWWLLLLATLLPLSAHAQIGLQSYSLNSNSAPAAQAKISLINTVVVVHQLTWNVIGTVGSCTVALDTSTDGISWSAGNAIAGQTCTNTGQSAQSASAAFNFVRVNVTTFTGTGSLTVTWSGYANPVAGAGFGTAPTTPNGVGQFACDVPAAGVAVLGYCVPGVVPRSQVGVSDTVLATDRGNGIVENNAGAIAESLPQSPTAGFTNNFFVYFKNIGAGTVTITPGAGQISGNNGTLGATLAALTGQTAYCYSDNTNYQCTVVSTGGGVGYGAGAGAVNVMTVTTTPAVSTNAAGTLVEVLPNLANTTTTPTLAVGGQAAMTIVKGPANGPLIASDYNTTQNAIFLSNGTQWQLLNPQAETVTGGTTAGFKAFTQGPTAAGTGQCAATNDACWQAPTAVTAYTADVPGAAPTNNNSGFSCTNASPSICSFAKMPQTAFLTADYTNAGGAGAFTSLVNLAFSVEANTSYHMHCNLVWSASAVTTGPEYQITGPASPTAVVITMASAITAITTASAAATAFSTALNPVGAAVTSATNEWSQVDMDLRNGANAGTVQVQASGQGVGTLTVRNASGCQLQ